MSGVAFGLVKRVTEILAFVQKMPGVPLHESHALMDVLGSLQDLLDRWPIDPKDPFAQDEVERRLAEDGTAFSEEDERIISRLVRNEFRAREARRRIEALDDAPQPGESLTSDGLVKSIDRLSQALEHLVNLLERRGDLFFKDSGSHVVGRSNSASALSGACHCSSSRVGDLNCNCDLTRGDCLGGAR